MENLIPSISFEPMPVFMLVLLAAGSLYILMKGADMLVDGAAGLAYRLGLPKIIVGATIVSMGTTSPEAAVSVMAAIEGKPGLALGNAVGSIIVDTGLIFGLGCVLVTLPADRFILRRQGLTQISCVTLLAALCYLMFWLHGDAAALTRPIGLLLLGLLAAYMAVSVLWSRQHPESNPVLAEGELAEISEAPRSILVLALLVVAGLAVVVFSSKFVIGSVTVLAVKWGIPQVVISATLVAFGTSLPELVVGMTAIFKGHKEILIGNVIGADILNVLFVVGAAATAADLLIIDDTARYPRIFLFLHLPTMLLIIALFLTYILTASKRGRFTRWWGYPLLALYVIYVVAQLTLETNWEKLA